MADITKYMTQLIPSSLTNHTSKSDKEVVDELKKDNLYLKIVNFYSELKSSNQKVSEGKDACPVYITWETDISIPSINCRQSRYLLTLISEKKDFGRIVELSCLYLQDIKMNFNFTRKGLIYQRKFS
jgi:hypothetical protein